MIGGGYATGRELAEFFLPSGPRGAYLGMLLAMLVWSLVCIVTFYLAHVTKSRDYRAFFKYLLGPFWVLFEMVYLLAIILILAVFGAAAGAISAAVLGWPPLVGTCCLIACISFVAAYGNESVERLFKWVTFFLYGVYALFVLLSFNAFGAQILQGISTPAPTTGWVLGGLTYAGYNVMGAVVILPVLRHLRSERDAVIAGALCRAAGHDSGAALLHLHDGLLPADRRTGAALGFPAAAPEPAGVPCAVPADDLPGAAGERHRLRARVQRARGARVRHAQWP